MFKDLSEFFEIKPKQLPILGKVYDFPGAISGKTGVLLHAMTAQVEAAKAAIDAGGDPDMLDTTILDDVGEEALRRELFGDAEQQMIDDGVPQPYIEHALKTLTVWHQFGEAVARAVWEDVDGGPKVKLPTDHRPKSRKGSPASASTTRRRASTKPTNRSKAPSPGPESSNTGD